jgi:HTH-type transcriptional regulator, transcriptional repressor of NAD biosynthesis genes
MVKAFVFGKFLPFHKGHEAMINFALDNCDFLSVLVCCDYDETIPGQVRKNWIKNTFHGQGKLSVEILQYDNRLLPNTSQTDVDVSKLWAAQFKYLYPDYDLLITSEPYGELVAGFMAIKHLLFDIDRARFSVSATMIRTDIFANWHYLPNAVKPFFALKIIILGTESTGKTTLAEQLSLHYSCSLVTEAGRDLIADSREFIFQDLLMVADEHAKRINETVLGDSPLIIIDTDIHITQSYAQFIFNRDLPISEAVYNSNKARLYLYLNNDVPYYQDGTRLNEKERDILDQFHRQTLTTHNIGFVEISGNWQNRFEQAIAEISKLIEKQTTISG